MYAGAQNGEDNGEYGEQKQAADLAAAFVFFGCLCAEFFRLGGGAWVAGEHKNACYGRGML